MLVEICVLLGAPHDSDQKAMRLGHHRLGIIDPTGALRPWAGFSKAVQLITRPLGLAVGDPRLSSRESIFFKKLTECAQSAGMRGCGWWWKKKRLLSSVICFNYILAQKDLTKSSLGRLITASFRRDSPRELKLLVGLASPNVYRNAPYIRCTALHLLGSGAASRWRKKVPSPCARPLQVRVKIGTPILDMPDMPGYAWLVKKRKHWKWFTVKYFDTRAVI